MQNDSIDNLRLDLNKKSVRGVIYVRSGDTRARTIHITLTNNGTVVDLADAVICELLILKPDGGMNDQTMVRYGNELQYTFRTADINVPGECKCQVMVTFNDAAVVTSSEFSVMVYQKEVDQELERSTNEYTAITEILVEVQDLKNQADQDADRAETARTSIEGSEEACRQYAESAALDATSASESATSAESSAENAETSASNAQSYAESAETNMIETRENLAAVEEKAEEILGYDSSAQQSAEDAAASAIAASASETSASNYANASQTSAGNSANSALDSEAWAKGTRSGSDIPATDPAYNNHSKYWAEKAQEAATSFPTHLSSFVNDMGFIDNTVNDLVNYYTQSQTYTQAEVNALIAAINEMNIEIVSSLPTEDIDTHTIYFVTRSDPQTGDYYEEYIYINNAWEHIGNTQVDLSSYYTKTETDTLLSAKVADNPTFTEASTRANIASGESFATILGKIKKWFTDLKAVAFSGSATDVSYDNDTNVKQKIDTKVSNEYNVLTSGSLLTFAEGLSDGMYLFRTNTSVTDVPFSGYHIGYIMVKNSNIKIVIHDMTSEALFVNSKSANGSWIGWFRNMFTNGGTFSGGIAINTANGTSSVTGKSILTAGNSTASGTVGNARGVVRLYSRSQYYADLETNVSLTENRNIDLPDKSGTLALTSDLDNYSRKAEYKNEASNTVTITIPSIGSHCFLIVAPMGLTTVGTGVNGSIDTVYSTYTEHPSTYSGNDVTVWVGNYYRAAVMYY